MPTQVWVEKHASTSNGASKVNQVTIALKDAEADYFRALCAQLQKSKANLVRAALALYCKHLDASKPSEPGK